MPEGDSIAWVVERMRPVLEGQSLTQAYSSRAPAIEQLDKAVVSRVRSHGKLMAIDTDKDMSILVHLRMKGRWRFLERAQRLSDSLYLRTERGTAICVGANGVSLHSCRQVDRQFARLGPDILAKSFDAQACAAGLLAGAAHQPLDLALLDQKLVAGLGNVYKSELLFQCQLSPWRRMGNLAEHRLTDMLNLGRGLMARNVGPGRRKTTPSHIAVNYYVYKRSGKSCLVCRGQIATERVSGRTTYYCANCQNVTDSQKRLAPYLG